MELPMQKVIQYDVRVTRQEFEHDNGVSITVMADCDHENEWIEVWHPNFRYVAMVTTGGRGEFGGEGFLAATNVTNEDYKKLIVEAFAKFIECFEKGKIDKTPGQ